MPWAGRQHMELLDICNKVSSIDGMDASSVGAWVRAGPAVTNRGRQRASDGSQMCLGAPAHQPEGNMDTRAIMKGSAATAVEVWPASGIHTTPVRALSSVPPYHCLALHLYLYRPHSTVPSFVLPRVGLSPLSGLTFCLSLIHI